jgi:predicted transposase YdaD
MDSYENSLKVYRDLKGVIDTAFDEGKAEGIAEGKAEGLAEGIRVIAIQAKRMGLSVADIQKLTGLSEEEIRQL